MRRLAVSLIEDNDGVRGERRRGPQLRGLTGGGGPRVTWPLSVI